MKILVLIGSLGKSSINRSVFEAYKKEVGDQASFEEGRFDDFPFYNDDILEAGTPAAVERLGRQIGEADAVMFFTPEYNYSVPGGLKNALDWVSRLKPQPFAGKPAAIVGSSPGKVGTARMQYHLRQIGVFLDLYFLNKPEVMISGVKSLLDDNANLVDGATLEHLRKHFAKFAEFASKFRS
jgi:chromate reductase, NAD(P)H dehydrogenase (quinone)